MDPTPNEYKKEDAPTTAEAEKLELPSSKVTGLAASCRSQADHAFKSCRGPVDLAELAPEKPLGEKSLAKMGICNNFEHWSSISAYQPRTVSFYTLVEWELKNNVQPTVSVNVDGYEFVCQLVVLKCYSKYFESFTQASTITLPVQHVSASAFAKIYEWMLEEKPRLKREGFVALLCAATYLQIEDLLTQCWSFIDKTEMFYDDCAFGIYMEAKYYGNEILKTLMLGRINKFFLCLVPTTEFVEMSARDICILFQSQALGVNSEVEIFLSALIWLKHDFPNRKGHLMDIMRTVRFNLMPCEYILMFSFGHFEGPEILLQVLKHAEVKEMITGAVHFSALRREYPKEGAEFDHYLQLCRMQRPIEREWVYDKNCEHHHQVNCPNGRILTFESFLVFLQMIQTVGAMYWRSLDLVANRTINCCVCVNCKKLKI